MPEGALHVQQQIFCGCCSFAEQFPASSEITGSRWNACCKTFCL